MLDIHIDDRLSYDAETNTVTRYTNSGFMRLKLGKELESRRLSSRVFETAEEARRSLAGRG